jgi:hypothetical protein
MLTADLERRAAAGVGADGRRVRGYAIVFNELSEDLGGFREIIEPSAVDRTFAEQIDVRALVDHDPAKVIGRKTADTLRLVKDDRGLFVEIDVPKTTAGDDILELVSRRDVSGMRHFRDPRVGHDPHRVGRRAVPSARQQAGICEDAQ